MKKLIVLLLLSIGVVSCLPPAKVPPASWGAWNNAIRKNLDAKRKLVVTKSEIKEGGLYIYWEYWAQNAITYYNSRTVYDAKGRRLYRQDSWPNKEVHWVPTEEWRKRFKGSGVAYVNISINGAKQREYLSLSYIGDRNGWSIYKPPEPIIFPFPKVEIGEKYGEPLPAPDKYHTLLQSSKTVSLKSVESGDTSIWIARPKEGHPEGSELGYFRTKGVKIESTCEVPYKVSKWVLDKELIRQSLIEPSRKIKLLRIYVVDENTRMPIPDVRLRLNILNPFLLSNFLDKVLPEASHSTQTFAMDVIGQELKIRYEKEFVHPYCKQEKNYAECLVATGILGFKEALSSESFKGFVFAGARIRVETFHGDYYYFKNDFTVSESVAKTIYLSRIISKMRIEKAPEGRGRIE